MYLSAKRFLRLSLLTWFIVFSISCFLAFGFARFIRTSYVEANAIQALKDLGVDVTFHYEHEIDGIGFDGMSGKSVPPGPNWVKTVFGETVLARIKFVRLEGELKTLNDCRDVLTQLIHLKSLTIDSKVLENVDALKHLKDLENITFYCESNSLKDIDALSKMKLSGVTIWSCNGLTSLESLGKIASLEKLKIHSCNGIRDLNLSNWKTESLKEVYVEGCNRLVNVSGFPQDSASCLLDLCDCEALEKVAIQPDSNLDAISIDNCTKLDSIGVLPDSLTRLYLSDCDALRKVRGGKLPKLTSVDIGSCNNLLSLDTLLESAEVLWLSECNGIERLSFSQPMPKLQIVRVESCDGLVSIDGLPESVEELDLSECQSLVRITAKARLPNLRIFDLIECPNLSEAPVKTRKGCQVPKRKLKR